MPKLVGPLFSVAAQGTFGKCVTYLISRVNHICRYQRMAVEHIWSAEMKHYHEYFKGMVWTYQHLPQPVKDRWASRVLTYRADWSGYNFFASYYLAGLIAGVIPDTNPPD